MARKVFISVLGTGNYKECIYASGNTQYDGTHFIQKATLQMLDVKEGWTESDRIYIIVTDGSKEQNWETRTDNGEPKIGLADTLKEMHLSTPIETIRIPDGNNEDEIWQIFSDIYKVLNDEDELYFDLTHGFRYLPMMVLVLGNYAKFLKHTEVKSITYGNYESRDKETNIAPIINITPLAALQDWTNAAADYLEHGDATKLKNCADKPLITIARETKGQDQDATTLIKLSKQLYEFSNLISFNRGDEIIIGKQSEQIKALLEKADAEYIRPMGPLFKQIAKSARNFNSDSPENMIEASRLCLDHSDFQASITLLQEGIVSMLCRKFHLDVKDKGDREIATQALNKLGLELQNKEYRPLSPYKETIIKRIIDSGIISSELANQWNKITEDRNDFNHAGLRASYKDAETLRNNISSYLSAVCDEISAIKAYVPGTPPLLVNLSNHPYKDWSEDQKKAAKKYGDVQDMAFPEIDPAMKIDKIKKEIAAAQIDEIKNMCKERRVTVHIMGEMSYTFYVVSQLKAFGIRCICSTSERDTEDLGGGEKKVSFHFKRFRDYDC